MDGFPLSPSLCPRWGGGSQELLLPPLAGPVPSEVAHKALKVVDAEDKVRALRMETQEHPEMSEPELSHLLDSSFHGRRPYFFQVYFLNMNVHEFYTEAPWSSFSGRYQTFAY